MYYIFQFNVKNLSMKFTVDIGNGTRFEYVSGDIWRTNVTFDLYNYNTKNFICNYI